MNNIKQQQQKERLRSMGRWTQMDKIELGYLEKLSARRFLSGWQIALMKVAFAQNHHVCDLTIILSVREFHTTIFEF